MPLQTYTKSNNKKKIREIPVRVYSPENCNVQRTTKKKWKIKINLLLCDDIIKKIYEYIFQKRFPFVKSNVRVIYNVVNGIC